MKYMEKSSQAHVAERQRWFIPKHVLLNLNIAHYTCNSVPTHRPTVGHTLRTYGNSGAKTMKSAPDPHHLTLHDTLQETQYIADSAIVVCVWAGSVVECVRGGGRGWRWCVRALDV